MAERVPCPRFVGGTGRLRTPQGSVERTINRFIESTLGNGGKVQRYLRPAEGLNPFAEVLDTDTSGIISQDGYTYCCTGTTFSQIFSDGTTIARGTIAYDPDRPATMAISRSPASGSGSRQLMIVSAGQVYVWNFTDETFVQVDFGDIVVQMCEFMDGYFFALERDSRRVYYSALEDATIWDFTFGYFERSWGGDNISFIKRSGRQLWVVGTKTSEVWADTGNANDPFAPIQGAFIDQGSIAPFAGQRDGETITWLNQDERGGGVVVRATGYSPSQISSYAVAFMIQQALTQGDLSRCEAFVHQLDNHRFYWLHVPNIDTTPVFDYTEQEWCERAMWIWQQAIWEPHIARCHAYAFERHLVGVRESGIIYQLAPEFLDDGVIV